MILSDRDLKPLLQSGVMENYSGENITNCGYDLTAYAFSDEKETVNEITLKPGESAFMSSYEIIDVPANMIVRIGLKNSRIRLGLTMDSPVYQPGHKTRVYVRLTNISANEITLKAGNKYVMALFEKLTTEVDNPYTGAFKYEFDFRNLGSYKDIYKNQVKLLEKKEEDLNNIEKSIYSNVLVILTIFVALFSFLSTNIGLVTKTTPLIEYLVYNFTLLGCVGFLLWIVNQIVNKEDNKVILRFTLAFFGLSLVIFIFFR